MKIQIQLEIKDLKDLSKLSEIDMLKLEDFNISKEKYDLADSVFFTTGNCIYKFFKDDKYEGVGLLKKEISFLDDYSEGDIKRLNPIKDNVVSNYRDKIMYKFYFRNWTKYTVEKEKFIPMLKHTRSEIVNIESKSDAYIRKKVNDITKTYYTLENKDNPNIVPAEVYKEFTIEFTELVKNTEEKKNELLGKVL